MYWHIHFQTDDLEYFFIDKATEWGDAVASSIEVNADWREAIRLRICSHANLLLNILIRKYGKFPDDYLIIGFDNSPISREAIIPISTIGQQIDTIAYEAVSLLVEQMNERKKRRPNIPDQPIHKIITPILLRRETTEGSLSFW